MAEGKMKSFEIDVSALALAVPLVKTRIKQYQNLLGKRIDVHQLIDRILADGKLNAADVAVVLALFIQSEAAPKAMMPATPEEPPRPRPRPAPEAPEAPPEAPETPQGVVPLASIRLERIRAVLPGKRFPGAPDNGHVDPHSETFNYGTAVTFEATLLDPDGDIIDTGKHDPNSEYRHTTVYYCKAPDGSIAQIGPGTGPGLIAKGTKTIGAGGKNYDDNNGTNATFRFGFADTPVDGEFKVWCEDRGIMSRVDVSRVS